MDDTSRRQLENRASEVWLEILASVAGGHRGVVVSAPPGAGKTRMVEDLALIARYGMGDSVCIAATTVAQVLDIASRLAGGTTAGVVIHGASGFRLPEDLARLGVGVATGRGEVRAALESGSVIIATVAKLAATDALHGQVDMLIVDEAWQVPDYIGAFVTGVGKRLILIGDSGQISPVVRSDTSRWADVPDGPHVALPVAVRARFGDQVALHHLVASRRVPEDTSQVLGPIFYERAFGSLSPPAELGWGRALCGGGGGFGRAVFDRLGQGSSLVLAECEAGPNATENERTVIAAGVEMVRALLSQAPLRVEEGGGRPLGQADFGVVCSRVRQVAAVKAGLVKVGLEDVRVETAERWQGLEREVMVGLHPASSVGDGGRFGLDAGRMCVMTSRHRLACVVVGDDGVEASILGAGGSGRILTDGVDRETLSCGAHLRLIDALCGRGDVVRL